MNNVQKKLLKTSIYTSPLIAVLCVAPVIMMVKPLPFATFQVGIVVLTVVVLCIWLINLGLYNLIEKYGSGRWSNQFRYLLSYLLVFGFIFFFKHILSSHGPSLLSSQTRPDLPNISYIDPAWAIVFSINTIILIIQNLIIIREKKSMIELENSRLKLRNAEAINQKLKQQIHPHFLFNSLNILKTLTKKEPKTATDYVVRLSGFLRSALSSANVNTVKLSEELELCIDYLKMQKIRFRSTLEYHVNVSEEVRESGFVPLFSIQLLLENAIKHNTMSRELPLHIQIRHADGWIQVSNNRQKRSISELSTGMGLDNLAERYQILSGDEIVIDPTEDQFSVSIKILDHERPTYTPEEHEILSDQ